MAKPKVAFDIGNSSLKVAVVKNDGIKIHEFRMPENMIEENEIKMPSAFSAFLKKIKKETGLPSGPAVIILPSDQCICRMVTTPKMTEEQLVLNLPYEFSDFINGDTEQFFCDYAMCELTEAEIDKQDEIMKMMGAVVSKKIVNDYSKIFSQGGFNVSVMIPREMALIRLVEVYKERNKDADNEYCFIDVGYNSTHISMIVGDRIQAERQIAIGCAELDKALANILNIDVFLTDNYKRINQDNILEKQECIEVYNEIAVEVLKVINFYHFTYRNSNLSGIYLIGGGANIYPLRAILQDTMGMPFYDVNELILGNNNDEKTCNIGVCAAAAALARG